MTKQARASKNAQRVASLLHYGIVCSVMALGLASSAWGACTADQRTDCRASCLPSNTPQFQTCYSNCIDHACNISPLPTCGHSAAYLYPKYYVLSLVYAPPGCTDTATLKCSSTNLSTVDYANGSSMGTKVSVDKIFKSDLSVKVEQTIQENELFFKLDYTGSVSGDWTSVGTDTTSTNVTKGTSGDIKVKGNADGIDHDQDMFVLLLNPAVEIRQDQSVVNNACGPNVTSWGLGLQPPGTLIFYELSAYYLKHPDQIPPNVRAAIPTLSNDDFKTILSLDPFANGSTAAPDPTRYALTTYSFPYEPPLELQDCNNGVCNCAAFSETITNSLVGDVVTAAETDYTLDLATTAKGSDTANLVGSTALTLEGKFTWTSKATQDNMRSSTQSATATILCPSTHYAGPTLMFVYWDTLFGTFLFVPMTDSAGVRILSQGNASDPSGKPLRHEQVALEFGNRKFTTWTNNKGDYVFAVPGRAMEVHAELAHLTIKGETRNVTLGNPVKLNVRTRLNVPVAPIPR